MKKEIWRPIFGGIYAVSNLGRVKRIVRHNNTSPSGVVSQHTQNGGYFIVHLYALNKRTAKTVHGLVAEAFLGPRPLGLDVNHKDGVKTNNVAANLEYVTRSQNLRHAVRMGLAKNGEKCVGAILTAASVLAIRRRYVRGDGGNLAREFGISAKTIYGIIHRNTWKHL